MKNAELLNKESAKAIIEKLSDYTNHYATVAVSDSDQGVTRFANSEINQNITIRNTNVCLTVYQGRRKASCSANVITDDGLKQLAKDAESILPHVPEGDSEAFPFSAEPAEEKTCVWNLSDRFTVEKRAAHIKEGVGRIPEGYTGAGALICERGAFAAGDTQGGFRYAAYDGIQFNTVVTHKSGAAGGSECCAYGDEQPDIQASFDEAIRIAGMARDPVALDIGAYTVVLSPVALGDLISFLCFPLSAKCLDDGDSYAAGKLGKPMFGGNITLRDDARFLGTRPVFFDYEGNVRRPVTLIENGVVRELLYDNKTAARHHVKPTGHALSNTGGRYSVYPMNIAMEGGTQSLEEIIAGVDRGIYINQFHYTNTVNPRSLQITGLTRNGAFLIENGKLGRAVTTMRFTQSLIESFNAVTALSKERTAVCAYDSAMIMPAARIEGFHFTGKQ